jgi:hypothetical protein
MCHNDDSFHIATSTKFVCIIDNILCIHVKFLLIELKQPILSSNQAALCQ